MKEINIKYIVDTISDNGVDILDFDIFIRDNKAQIHIIVPTTTTMMQLKRINDALKDDYDILNISESLFMVDDKDVAECCLLWNI